MGALDDIDDGVDMADDLSRAALGETDVDNARRIIGPLAREAFSVEGIGWHVWDGSAFSPVGGKKRVEGLIGDTLRPLIEAEATALSRAPVSDAAIEEKMAVAGVDRETAEAKVRGARRTGRWKHAQASANVGRIRAARDLAEGRILYTVDACDARRSYFQAGNGTIDLETIAAAPEGEDAAARRDRWARALIAPHAREGRPTRASRVLYDPDATAPGWARFLEHALPDPAMRAYAQRIAGLTLWGQMNEAVIFLQGKGGNGKSAFTNGLSAVWGRYAEPVRIEMWLMKQGGPASGPTPEEACLPGARVYQASEPEDNATISGGKLKQLTGGDAIQVHAKGKDPFYFTPIGVPVIQCNRVPHIRDASDGFWRRIHVVPFSVNLKTLPVSEQVTSDAMAEQVAREAPGILNWMLEGFAAFRAAGSDLCPPDAAEIMKRDLRGLSDPVGEFLGEAVVAETGGRTRTTDLFRRYVTWCEERDEKPWTNRSFAAHLIGLQYARCKIRGDHYWMDISMAEPGKGAAARPDPGVDADEFR